ncbi:subtilisin-like serine protease pr1c [Colletotrichum chrysophilum]|uniref:Subtilisin-like serine protease pr1c n=1 Tax=Colletotrichum chrysophilum TaxID=1836956 RepID=A0AAD9EAC2_9PEZI|nr:subtilisin-like serine protease pr1c [Colletotrichum chrysophilum]
MHLTQLDVDPIDTCQGYGTLVAGTITPKDSELGYTGAAPDVTLDAY